MHFFSNTWQCTKKASTRNAQIHFWKKKLYCLLGKCTCCWILRRDEPHQDVIFAETLPAYMDSVSCLIPFDQDEWAILRNWKGQYLYGLFDYGFQNEKESRHLQVFTDLISYIVALFCNVRQSL